MNSNQHPRNCVYEEERIARTKAEYKRFEALLADLLASVAQRSKRQGDNPQQADRGICADLKSQAMHHALVERLICTGVLDEMEYLKEVNRHVA